jgi:hypothetical protein
MSRQTINYGIDLGHVEDRSKLAPSIVQIDKRGRFVVCVAKGWRENLNNNAFVEFKRCRSPRGGPSNFRTERNLPEVARAVLEDLLCNAGTTPNL